MVLLVMLVSQRDTLNRPKDDAKKQSRLHRKNIQSTKMLWEGYRPTRYWYEIFEFFRKLLQTSVFAFVSTSRGEQILFLLSTCALSILVVSTVDPYERPSHNFMAQFSQWSIFFVVFSTLLSEFNQSGEVVVDGGEPAIVFPTGLLVCAIASVPFLGLLVVIHGRFEGELPSSMFWMQCLFSKREDKTYQSLERL